MKQHLHRLQFCTVPAHLCLFCVLAGCASAPAPIVQRVDVPVPVSCIKSQDVPAKPGFQFDKLQASASDGEKVIALASDWPVGRKYEGQLEAVIAGCR